MLVCRRGELETERDCYVLTPSSSDHSSTSSSFCWAAQPWVLWAQAHVWSIISPTATGTDRFELTASNSNCNSLTKSSVAPGYIIVCRPPALCGRTHLQRIQPRPQVKVIFRYLRPDALFS